MQKFVVVLFLFCNIANKLFCNASETIGKKVLIDIKAVEKKLILGRTKIKFETVNKTDDSYSEKPEQENENDSNKELKSKSYEVFEDVIESESVPLPYHLQNQILKVENETIDEELHTAESKYNVPVKVTHSYQVTENINEDEEEENKINSRVPIHQRNYPLKFYNRKIDHSYYNRDNNKIHHSSGSKNPLYTTAVFKKEDDNRKQPLSIIVLRPIAHKPQDDHPVNVKVLKPVVLSSETDYETGNILIDNKPILTLTAVKSYAGNYKKFDYQKRHHDEIDEDDKDSTYKPILINVLKSKHEDSKNIDGYKNLYDTLLNDGYKKTYDVKDNYDNERTSGSNSERYKSNEVDYVNKNVNEHTPQESSEQSLKKNNNLDNPRQFLIYVVNKKKPYAYVRRANKHR